MSSLCQKIERAVRSWIRMVAQDNSTLLLELSDGTLAVTDEGLYIELTTGGSYTIPILIGETEETMNPPCIIIVCSNAQQEEDKSPWWFCDLSVEVRVPQNSWTDGEDAQPDVVASIETISQGIANVLFADGFEDNLDDREDELCVLGRAPGGTRQRTPQGRMRIHRYGMTLYAAEEHIDIN